MPGLIWCHLILSRENQETERKYADDDEEYEPKEQKSIDVRQPNMENPAYNPHSQAHNRHQSS